MGITGGIGKAGFWGICLWGVGHNRVPALRGWWGARRKQNWCQKNYCNATPYVLVHSSKVSGAGMNSPAAFPSHGQ